MVPRRMIDSEIWRNEKVGNLPAVGRLLFIGIFSNADDAGRLKASPRFLRATIFPYDNDKTEDQIRALRDQCAELKLIRLYSKNGQEYLDIPSWKEHQKIRKDRQQPSKLPGFDDVDNQMTTKWQPDGNQMATNGMHRGGEDRLVKVNTPKGGRQKTPPPAKETEKNKGDGKPVPAVKPDTETEGGGDTPAKKLKVETDPRVNEIFAEMRRFFGYPEKTDNKDPIPNYPKEGQFAKKLLGRHFTREQILDCWMSKQTGRGEFVSLAWVNEDIVPWMQKKGSADGESQKPDEEDDNW